MAKKARKSRKHSKCRPVRISRGPLKGHFRNPCTGELVKKPRGK